VWILLRLILYIIMKAVMKWSRCFKISTVKSPTTTSYIFQLISARQWHSALCTLQSLQCVHRGRCVLWNPETKKAPQNRDSWSQHPHRTNILHTATHLGLETQSCGNWISFCFRTVRFLLNSARYKDSTSVTGHRSFSHSIGYIGMVLRSNIVHLI